MATKPLTPLSTPYDNDGSQALCAVAQSVLLNGDDSRPLLHPHLPYKSITLTGTPGAGFNALVEVCNDPALAVWVPAHDQQGLVLATVTALPRAVQIAEKCYATRVRISAGDGTTNVVATFCATRF